MSDPHCSLLFNLFAKNARARKVLQHHSNKHLVYMTPEDKQYVKVGIPLRKSSTTLLTLGRGRDADLHLGDANTISRIQCSFEIDLETGIVMFNDNSRGGTSQVFGANAMKFEHGRLPRRIVVSEKLNTQIGMGGVQNDLFLFELEWLRTFQERTNVARQYRSILLVQREDPCAARTVDEAPTELLSHRMTRLHTPASLKIRYLPLSQIGEGQFGQVHKVVDVDSGQIMAVKILRRPNTDSNDEAIENWRQCVQTTYRREINLLVDTSHVSRLLKPFKHWLRLLQPHIVDYKMVQGGYDGNIEIFMGLKEGTLEMLTERGQGPAVAETALRHILSALDYIACRGIVHRDVKPANILYTTRSSKEYLFQLGDFGLCSRVSEAVTYSGTPIYMAPEIVQNGKQSCKTDIWSLMVTILVTLNKDEFFQKISYSNTQCHSDISSMASNMPLKEMAIIDASRRATAAQMLVKLFKGEGLTTPLPQVPPLSTDPTNISVPIDRKPRMPSVLTSQDEWDVVCARKMDLPNLRRGIRRGQAGVSKAKKVR